MTAFPDMVVKIDRVSQGVGECIKITFAHVGASRVGLSDDNAEPARHLFALVSPRVVIRATLRPSARTDAARDLARSRFDR